MRVARSLLILPFLGLLVVAIAAFATVAPRRWFYQQRRPTRLGRFANATMGIWSSLGGPPSYMVRLETTGWRSGVRRGIPIVISEYQGKEYVVSMLGERSPWVKNIRAGGGRATLRHGRARDVRLVEVPPPERAPIIRAYLERAIGGRPVSDFEPVAGDYPVFRIEPAG
jgi:hypothetical protein